MKMSDATVSELRPKAQSALSSSPVFALRELTVEQVKDCLRISGRVSSFYHKQLAQEVVRSVAAGRVSVINSVAVS